jgi:hypothetical protein
VPREAGAEKTAAHAARLNAQHEYVCDSVLVRKVYRCRAYPGQAQQQVLARTFGCVRVVWNRTLAGPAGDGWNPRPSASGRE